MMRKTSVNPMSEEQAIAALNRIVKRWPQSLWLWAASGSLHIMKCNPDGSRQETRTGGYADASVGYVSIPCDGGDW